jgi:group I intron endonuclease
MVKIVCGIYKITSPSGRVYIGQSLDIYRRWKGYLKIENIRKQCLLYFSLKKYGAEKHKFEILNICLPEELNDLEIYYGELYDCINPEVGLNLKLGNARGKNSEISNEKNRLSQKLRFANGAKTPWDGKKQPEELVRKRVEARKGYVHSDDTKRKIGDTHKDNKYCLGLLRTVEERKQNSVNRKNYWAKRREIKAATEVPRKTKYPHEINLRKGRKGSNHSQWGRGRPVIQYDLNGNKITEFASANTAIRAIGREEGGSNIKKCCEKIIPTCYGYKWKYAD